jgi:hypothetical protein
MGVLLVFVGAFSGIGGIGRVKASAGQYSITFNLGNVEVDTATLTFEFIDSNNVRIGDIHSLQIGMESGITTASDSGNLPDDVVRINLTVGKAGKEFTRDSSIKLNGETQGISGGIEDGQIFDLTSDDEFIVDLTLDNPNNGGGNPPPPPGGGQKVTINYTRTGEGEIGCIKLFDDGGRFWGFDTDRSLTEESLVREDIGGSNQYFIQVEPAPGCMLESWSVNGTPINGFDPVEVIVEDGTEISIEAKVEWDPDYSNVLWGYDDSFGWDNYVDPGTGIIEIAQIRRGDNVLFAYNGSYADWECERPGGHGPTFRRYHYIDAEHQITVSLEVDVDPSTNEDVILSWYGECRRGDIFTFQFIPQPGYQLAGARINGFALEPQEEECMFNIVMSGLLHVDGAFVEAGNQVAVTSNVVTAASVEGTGNIDKGTLAASVSDAASPSDDVLINAMENAEDFIESYASVDISMTQIISKGGDASYAEDSEGYWATEISALNGQPVDLQLAVPAEDLAEGQTYGIIREHIDGEGTHVDELDATYNSTTGMLSFSSDLFSTYTIIKISGTPDVDDGGPIEGNPDDVSDDVIPDEIYNGDSEAVQQFKSDMANLLSDYDGLASGLNIGNTVSNDGGQTHTVTTFVTTQGPKCREAFAIGTPIGFNEAFSFNLLVDGKAVYDSKSGFMVIRIPEYLKKTGRVFALVAVDKNGVPHTYGDLDLNPDTLCVQIDFEGYAFEVIYADI